MRIFKNVDGFFRSGRDPDRKAHARSQPYLPTLWLLGKTGAGKSTLIRAVTGISRVEIGSGFAPCTMTAVSYDFPEEMPLVRFLDTRGLADADYDPASDIEACRKKASALVIVMKAEEPEQGEVIKALAQIRRSGRMKAVLLVHTGIYLVADPRQREMAIAHNQAQAEKAWGGPIESVALDFELEDGSSVGVDLLREKLADRLPIVDQLAANGGHGDGEFRHFTRLKPEILWYARTAGASDFMPLVGAVSVPAIQAKMLHAIAGRYGMQWNRQAMAGFAAALGAGFALQYGARLGIRQLVKLIPVYGQTIGGAAAAAVSYSSTYAIGRAACKYLYHKSKGEPVSEADLREMYRKAFEEIRRTAESETSD